MKRAIQLAVWVLGAMAIPCAGSAGFETEKLKFLMLPQSGQYQITDRTTGVVWRSNPLQARFGEAVFVVDGKKQVYALSNCELKQEGTAVEALFKPNPRRPGDVVRVRIAATADGGSLVLSYEAGGELDSIRLLDEALGVEAEDRGYVAVPVREGLLLHSDSGREYSQAFGTSEYEGTHMAMLGVVKRGSAALITWDDFYVVPHVRSTLPRMGGLPRQTLLVSVVLRKGAKSMTVSFLGKGDYVTIAKAYRERAKQKGLLVSWDQKLKSFPLGEKYFGASNVKLWSLLSRRMNPDSTQQRDVTVNWTFDEAAQVAEHLKNDLKLDRVLFILGGWIHRGYDNQHPDILPTAPECGGDAAFSAACKRIKATGYLLGLHDNYQDIYKDAPSWNEELVQKRADGSLYKGGTWAGGLAYFTCAQKAVDLAKRPQNLPGVKKLSDADSYFIDTTYAVGPQECFDPKHPLTRADDIKWKQVLSNYSRGVFGTFGSECGREWAIPHAEFFEGLTGVSGRYFHNLRPEAFGATVVPLFELVYRDCIALYGKYGYDARQSAEYVLHHISIGRPLHYHSVPAHLYWKNPETKRVAATVSVTDFKSTSPRQFSLAYKWQVQRPIGEAWNVFVHFTDAGGKIQFQGDFAPKPGTAEWTAGPNVQGPFVVNVPAGALGTFDVRVGMFKPKENVRASYAGGVTDMEGRLMAGQVKVSGGAVEYIAPAAVVASGDKGMYVRGDGGWTEGLHSHDRFLKNTHEILSPLNEITSRMAMTNHEFLTADRLVRRSTFGEGAVVVTVNGSEKEVAVESKIGGRVVLPAYGFLAESPTFVAFCATEFNGLKYAGPALFALRSMDGKAVAESAKIRVFHGFGEGRIKLGVEHAVEKEGVVGWR